MEILPHVHQIPVNFKNRPLHLYLLISPQTGEGLLMDTGDVAVPDQYILPYFKSIGFDPQKLAHVLLTHPDLDHIGGIYGVKKFAPHAKFYCGTQDAVQIESPEHLADLRARAHYHFHGLGPNDQQRADFINRCGGPGQHTDFAQIFNGGEIFNLVGHHIQILHVPGHSLGHLAVYLPDHETAIIGDAVHGTANRFLPDVNDLTSTLKGKEGPAAFACTYMWVDSYLGTINRLQAMNLERLYSCHWPNCENPATVDAFLNASREYALKAEAAILETLRTAKDRGLTLKEICVQAKPLLGDWPAEKDTETRSMACGHLQRLFTQGLVRFTDEIPTRYFAVDAWQGLR